MRTAQLLLFGLLMCQTTESLNEKRVNLGQNVTLDCPIGVSDIYWVFQKQTDSPVLILRTFTTDSTTPQFYDKSFKDKCSLQTYSRLFISNLTIAELGIYYCAKTAKILQLSNGTRLYTIKSVQNQTEYNIHKQPQCEKCEIHNILTVTSLPLNIVLIIAIGLLMLKLKKPRKSRQQPQNVETVPLEDLNAAEYSEIDLHTYSGEENPVQINGTYVLLQKPKANPRSTQAEINTSCSLQSC